MRLDDLAIVVVHECPCPSCGDKPAETCAFCEGSGTAYYTEIPGVPQLLWVGVDA
jgi:hypothetical protein